MTAAIADQPDIATLVAEENQVLAEEADEPRRLFRGQLLSDDDWVPVATQ
jgi:hypothetical protein